MIKPIPFAIATTLSLAAASTAAVQPLTFTIDNSNATTGTMSLSASSLGSGLGGVLNNPSSLTSGANVYNYVAVFFVPSSTGSYTFGQSSAPVDTVMILYDGSFNAAAPGTGALVGNDDGLVFADTCGSAGRCPKITSNVTSGHTYSLVVSTFSPNTALGLPLGFYSTGGGSFLASVTPLLESTGYVPHADFRTLGAAQTLDSLNGGSGQMANLLTTLSAMTPEQQSAVLERLAPVTNRAVQLSLRNNMLMSFDRFSARMDSMRQIPISGGASGDAQTVHGLWLKPFGGGLRQNSTAGFAGYDGSTWGLAGGYDYAFTTNSIAGLAFSYTNTRIGYNDQQSDDSNKIDGYEISAYGTHNFGIAYLEAMAAWAKQTYATQRDTSLNGLAHGSFDGDIWGARIGGGIPFTVYTNTTLTPMVRLDWNHISQNSYTESGAGALNLAVAAANVNRLRSSLGAQLNHNTSIFGAALQPFVRVFWHYDFLNTGVSSSASFAGGGAAFITPGQKLDHYTGTVGAGINLFTQNNLTASVAYDYNVGSAYQAHTAQAQIRLDF